ncbi:hypothetical protein [Rossellomorea marisflavi]|uniref:hypothetical protein n=1 Tax=Rossellomorea marisflavi TaxID=189381 RepID=UPI003514AC66
MNGSLDKPKGFGEILDYTFRLSKMHFKTFFLVFLTLIGPLFLLQALIGLLTGTSFFKDSTSVTNIFTDGLETWATNLEEEQSTLTPGYLIGTMMTGLVGTISLFLYPAAQGAIMFAVNHIRKGESFTLKQILKEGFSRYGPLLGSTLLLSVIGFGMFFVPTMAIIIIGMFGMMIDPIFGVVLYLLMFLAAFVGIMYFFVRWGFGVAVSCMEVGQAPGLGRSWHLTKKRVWPILGLFVVFGLIIAIISGAFELTLGLVLGNSVVYQMIVNLVTLFTTMIVSVGYSVIYFDLKTRNDGDDLNQLIDDYKTV